MIKFFRIIRQKLLKENQTGKYLKYAIGEILLVIIGILIAVSINGWNENRKLRIQEQALLKDIRTEVASNLIALEEVILEHEKSYKTAQELVKLFQDREAFNVLADSIYVPLLFNIDKNYTYDPNNGILNSMISSGQINNLSNNEIKYLLASIKEKTVDAFEEANIIGQQQEEIMMGMWAGTIIKEDGKIVGSDFRKSYDNTEYRTMIYRLFIAYRMNGLQGENKLKETMKHILELIDQEIDK